MRFVKNLGWLVVLFCVQNCASRRAANSPVLLTTRMGDAPQVGKTADGRAIPYGGLSGLRYLGPVAPQSSVHRFVTLTDRGPNAEVIKKDGRVLRPFAVPSYSPHLIFFTIDRNSGRWHTEKLVALTNPQGSPVSGRPPALRKGEKNGMFESPVDLHGKDLPGDPWGVDTESLELGDDDTFWIGEEYAPSLLHVNSEGRILDRFIPKGSENVAGQQKLPDYMRRRVINRGFEGIARLGSKMYLFIEAPLPRWKKAGESTILRVLEFDISKKEVTGVFALVLSSPEHHIGDAAVWNNRLWIMERDYKEGVQANKSIYTLDLGQSSNLLKGRYERSLEDFEVHELAKVGIRPIQKNLVWTSLGKGIDMPLKIEGLSPVADNEFAIVSDNDFELDGGVDFSSGHLGLRTEPHSSRFLWIRSDSPPSGE